ncbi:MAG: signal peptidase II [Polyangiaceae bacterium]|jgi:signal peptidase II|nr:signal peptidase II [Polyangiaceae bacterium]
MSEPSSLSSAEAPASRPAPSSGHDPLAGHDPLVVPDPLAAPPDAPASRPLTAHDGGTRPGYPFLAIVSAISLFADLATKTWAERALVNADKIETPKTVIKGFFMFVLRKNQGGAWGVLQTAPENVRKPFFIVVSVFAILFIVSLYRRLHPSQAALRWGLPLVLGGALGNLVDRIRYGSVIDFIDIQVRWGGSEHHWPTFNVADIAICVGVALMAIDMLSPRRGATLIEGPPSTRPSRVPAGGNDA